jgi:hypothetical protein
LQGIAQKDLEQAVSDQQSAEGALKAARDAVRVFGKTEAEIDRYVATRKIDPLLVVPCPITGEITARNAAPGLFVQPGNPPAPYTVADISTMWDAGLRYRERQPGVSPRPASQGRGHGVSRSWCRAGTRWSATAWRCAGGPTGMRCCRCKWAREWVAALGPISPISCHAPRHGPSLPLQRILWRDARGRPLCEHGAPPSRDFRPRDAWPLLRGAGQHAWHVLTPSCDVQQLSWTWNPSEIDISQMAGDIYRPRGRVESRTRKFNASASLKAGRRPRLKQLAAIRAHDDRMMRHG